MRLLVAWLVSALALGVAVWLLDNLTANSFWDLLWASAITAVVGLLIRPAIVLVSAYVGWIAVVLAGLLGQALVTYVALEISPGITTTVGAAIVASWIVAATGTAVAWLTTSGTDDAFALSLERGRKRVTTGRRPRGRRHRLHPARRPPVPGAALGDRGRLGADHASLGVLR